MPYGGFHSLGGIQNGWFTRENPTKIRMITRGTPIFGNLHMFGNILLGYYLTLVPFQWPSRTVFEKRSPCNLAHWFFKRIYEHINAIGIRYFNWLWEIFIYVFFGLKRFVQPATLWHVNKKYVIEYFTVRWTSPRRAAMFRPTGPWSCEPLGFFCSDGLLKLKGIYWLVVWNIFYFPIYWE